MDSQHSDRYLTGPSWERRGRVRETYRVCLSGTRFLKHDPTTTNGVAGPSTIDDIDALDCHGREVRDRPLSA